MNDSDPWLPGDYPCHCVHCEPPDPKRDWLAEALAIYHGSTRLLAQREHIVALINRMVDSRLPVISSTRLQTAGVQNPVTREELRESPDMVEKFVEARRRPSLFNIDLTDPKCIEKYDKAKEMARLKAEYAESERAAQEQVAHE